MVEDEARDPSEELAAWLKDAGHRRWNADRRAPRSDESAEPAEPPEMLVKYLEQLAGRSFRSKDDIRGYIAEISGLNSVAGGNSGTRQLVRQTFLLLGLLTAYMQYNFIDVSLQISRLPATIIFVPVDAGTASNRSGEPVRTGDADRGWLSAGRA